MPQTSYYNELQVKTNSCLEQITDFVMSSGIDAIEFIDDGIIIRSEDDLQTLMWGIDEFIKQLSTIFHEDIKCSFDLQKKANEDWISKYQQSIKPLEVGNFYIRPSWEEQKNNLTNIIINPALAFGSGHHESTYSCILMLEKYLKKDDKLLDVGCGSGILSIVGSKMGALVDSCDTDEQATQSTKENEKLNNIALNDIWTGSVDMASQTYDVVVANIIADILVVLSHDFDKVLKKGSILILSGILQKYENSVLKSFAKLKHLQTYAKNEWRTIVLQKG